jgi:cysteine synthase
VPKIESIEETPAASSRSRTPTPVDAMAPMVGNTPLIEVLYESRGRQRRIYAKYEQRNMTGSTKDRMALWILRSAYLSGDLQPGDTIAEATSGNTGIAFAAMGRALGHPVRIFMPDWMSQERVSLIRSFGADIVKVSREQGGFRGSIEMADDYARQEKIRGRRVFLPHQFDNPANVEAHEHTTGPEILRQINSIGRRVDAFVAGVGTGGTVMGVGRALRTSWRKTRVHPLEPANSPTLTTGCKFGHHRIQGISDEFIPSIVDLSSLDPIISVWDGDSVLMAQALGHTGLAVGISSGANFLGADMLLDQLGEDACVTTVFADSNKKYLSTALCAEEPVKDGYISPGIRLLSWTAIG